MDPSGNFWKEGGTGLSSTIYGTEEWLFEFNTEGQLISQIDLGATYLAYEEEIGELRDLSHFQIDSNGMIRFVQLSANWGYLWDLHTLHNIDPSTAVDSTSTVFHDRYSASLWCWACTPTPTVGAEYLLSPDTVLTASTYHGWELLNLATGQATDLNGTIAPYIAMDLAGRANDPNEGSNYDKLFVDNDGLLWLATQGGMFALGQASDITKSSFTDSNGHTTTYGPTSTTDALGNTTTFTRNSAIQVTQKTDPDGNTTHYQYQGPNRTFKGIQVGSNTYAWTYGYDPTFNEITQEVKPDGTTTNWTYDANGNLTQVAQPDGRTFQYTYYGNGLVSTMTDPRGKVTSYLYNPDGTLATRTLPDGSQYQYAYDSFGNVAQVTDPNGHVVRMAYDALDRLTSKTYVMDDGSEQTYTYTYDSGPSCGCLGSVDQVASLTDPRGNTTLFHYDVNDHLTEVQRPDQSALQWSYDGEDNKLTSTDANGNVTRYGYDAADQLKSVTDPLGNATRYQYDPAGNRTAVTDPRGFMTTYAYDALRRLVQVNDAKGGATLLGYDKASNLVSITDPRGKVTTRTYDGLNELLSETDPLAHTTSYTYDLAGNRLTKTDANQQETTYTYDALDRLTQEVTPDDTLTYTYDPVGDVLAAANKNGEEDFQYDARDQLVSKTDANTGRKLQYTYDPSGNVASMIDAEGKVTTYAYDTLDRMTGLVFDPAGKNLGFGFTYDADGHRIGLTRPNGVATSYSYDNAGELLGIVSAASGSTPVQNLTYAYDADGNRIQKADGAATASYSYDQLDQLIGQSLPGGTATTWTYDPAGNRLSTGTGSATTTYSYNDANELQSISDGSAFSYDPDGSTVSEVRNGVTTAFSCNAENHLEQVTRGGQTWASRYDAFGQRVKATDPSGNPLTLLNDRDNRTEEYGASGNLVARNVFAGLDEPLARIDAQGNVSYTLADGLGSITGLTDASGSV
ncbi:MAG: hypothetical protein KGR26_05345, partial [Cyanobacteria bacterium REEB65]|nr:hypothetical protein [Cyanobacteria bacterium REEB65]